MNDQLKNIAKLVLSMPPQPHKSYKTAQNRTKVTKTELVLCMVCQHNRTTVTKIAEANAKVEATAKAIAHCCLGTTLTP